MRHKVEKSKALQLAALEVDRCVEEIERALQPALTEPSKQVFTVKALSSRQIPQHQRCPVVGSCLPSWQLVTCTTFNTISRNHGRFFLSTCTYPLLHLQRGSFQASLKCRVLSFQRGALQKECLQILGWCNSMWKPRKPHWGNNWHWLLHRLCDLVKDIEGAQARRFVIGLQTTRVVNVGYAV
jgi:hypothetical protein